MRFNVLVNVMESIEEELSYYGDEVKILEVSTSKIMHKNYIVLEMKDKNLNTLYRGTLVEVRKDRIKEAYEIFTELTCNLGNSVNVFLNIEG